MAVVGFQGVFVGMGNFWRFKDFKSICNLFSRSANC
jgi:hypothetical protein